MEDFLNFLNRRPCCPYCQGQQTIKNGSTHNKKQKFKCKQCGKQFVENSTKKKISQETKNLIDQLLLDKISFDGILRSFGVSPTWRQNYVNKKYAKKHRKVKLSEKAKGKLIIE